MAFVNLPPNLQDIFGGITDRIAKLETGPNQAMYTAEGAQGTAASASAQATSAQATADASAAAAAAAYSVASTAVQVSANTIVNASNQMTAINGNGITVYSGNSATSGARVVLNSAGLAGFNAGGTSTFALDSATGNVSLTGTITSTAGQIGGWTISAGSLFSGTSEMNATTGNAVFNGVSAFGQFYGYSSLYITTTGYFGGTLEAAGSVTMGSGAANPFYYLSSSGTLRSAYTYGKSVSGRTMLINSSGDFGTSLSTERKKKDIKNHTINTNALLQLEVKSFKYNSDIDETQNPEYGFIAEDADRLGLYELAGYDQDGLPDYFAYEKLPIFL